MTSPSRPQPTPTVESDILDRLSTIERLLLKLLDQPLQQPHVCGYPVPLSPLPGSPPPTPPGNSLILSPDDFRRDPPEPHWIPVLHRPKHVFVAPPGDDPHAPYTEHTPGCGKPALYLTRPFSTRERADITAMRVRFPGEQSWRQPKPGDVSLCSTCGMPINPWSDRDLDYAAVLLDEPEVRRVRRRRSAPASISHPTPPFPTHTAEADAQVRTALGELQEMAGSVFPAGLGDNPDA